MTRIQKRIIETGLRLLQETGCDRMLVFLNTARACRSLLAAGLDLERVVFVLPKTLPLPEALVRRTGRRIIRNWAGNQSRFSRIKYAFLSGVLDGTIDPDNRIVCALGPWNTDHIDTLTIHDLKTSWSEEFPFDPRSLIARASFQTVMAVVDIALDIGALGREGKSVGTAFIIGEAARIMELSHQAVFNPFRGYPRRERLIRRPEVVESLKELAQLDGAILISDQGVVEAAGRHLDAAVRLTRQLRGLGSRHRAAAGISRKAEAVAVVVSESTGRVTIFDHGRIIATLEPVISRRLE